MKIARKISSGKYLYTMENDSLYTGAANWTFGIRLLKICVSDSNIFWEVKQTNYIIRIINSLPFLSLEDFTPYKFYQGNIYIGISKKKIFRAVYDFKINENSYELRLHNNNYFSLMKNNIQIALYQKEKWTINEENQYRVKFDSIKENKLIIFLFCIFSDAVFFTDNKATSIKYEKNYPLTDSYSERVKWSAPIDISSQ